MREFLARLHQNYTFLEILKFFHENSIENLNFYLFLGTVIVKNRAFGNNIISLQQFFPVRGEGFEPPTPCLRHCFLGLQCLFWLRLDIHQFPGDFLIWGYFESYMAIPTIVQFPLRGYSHSLQTFILTNSNRILRERPSKFEMSSISKHEL